MGVQYSLGDGARSLVDAIVGGGDQAQQQGYDMQRKANLADAIGQQDLIQKTGANQAWATAPQDYAALGATPEEGTALAHTGRATGSNVQQIGELLKIAHDEGFRKAAALAQGQGNTQGSNFNLAEAGKTPLKYTDVDNAGNPYDPNVTPNRQGPQGGDIGGDQKAKPLTDTNKLSFYDKPVMGKDGFTVVKQGGYDQDRFNNFQMWAMDNGAKDLNAALPRFLQQEQLVRTNIHSVLTAAQKAVKDGAAPARVRQRLSHIGVTDEQIKQAGL